VTLTEDSLLRVKFSRKSYVEVVAWLSVWSKVKRVSVCFKLRVVDSLLCVVVSCDTKCRCADGGCATGVPMWNQLAVPPIKLSTAPRSMC